MSKVIRNALPSKHALSRSPILNLTPFEDLVKLNKGS